MSLESLVVISIRLDIVQNLMKHLVGLMFLLLHMHNEFWVNLQFRVQGVPEKMLPCFGGP